MFEWCMSILFGRILTLLPFPIPSDPSLPLPSSSQPSPTPPLPLLLSLLTCNPFSSHPSPHPLLLTVTFSAPSVSQPKSTRRRTMDGNQQQQQPSSELSVVQDKAKGADVPALEEGEVETSTKEVPQLPPVPPTVAGILLCNLMTHCDGNQIRILSCLILLLMHATHPTGPCAFTLSCIEYNRTTQYFSFIS
jgi:hypothetical protein